jgi:outer membrane protein assembly factor BamD (BamD/ComL family)
MTVTAAMLVLCAHRAQAQSTWGIVTVDTAQVYTQADETSPAIGTLRKGMDIESDSPPRCGTPGRWCAVYVRGWTSPRGWMHESDLVVSKGVASFWSREYDQAVLELTEEIRETRDDEAATWMQFFLAYAHWEAKRPERAAAILGQITLRHPVTPLTPLAYIAAGLLERQRKNANAELRWYEALHAAFPDYRHADSQCGSNPVTAFWDLCGPDVVDRIEALRAFITVQTDVERIVADGSTPLEQSAAWYRLGEAFERRNTIDRLAPEAEEEDEDARRCYETAIRRARGSDPAGRAAWRLISLSAATEWGGDLYAETQWMRQSYGRFLREYPSHEHAAEAKFELARATWADAGYPEVLGYIESPGTWDDWRREQQNLDQWFDTRGFGGGVGMIPTVRHPPKTRKALAMYRDLVREYPHSSFAPLAQYYSAVILDYCLHNTRAALTEYQAFLDKYPQTELYAPKAANRVSALGALKQ